MLEFINKILLRFQSCFSRKAAFGWFVTIVLGLMIRTDSLGVTSIIRDLSLAPAFYETMIHFFHADSWKLENILSAWFSSVAEMAPRIQISERTLLIGDGVKRASDGKFMPCTKKMVQESEDSSKSTFVHGHFFGAVGVLIGSASKAFCLPLSIQLHDGNQMIREWNGEDTVSHVIQMFKDGCRAASYFGRCLFVLDRYFLSVPLLQEWKTYQKAHPDQLHIITRAKRNCTAYEKPGEYKGIGRKPVRGAAVKVLQLFETEAESFQTAQLRIYGTQKEVRFLSKEYLWGQTLYLPLQFVLAEYDQRNIILVSTDLKIKAEDIIMAYAWRFKIEAMFREMKQQFGGFQYHFWSHAVPKLDRYRKKNTPDPLTQVTEETKQARIVKAVKATEGYVMLSCIATGIIQMLCLNYEAKIEVLNFRYLRTSCNQVMSEASMMEYLRRNLFRFMAQKDELTITKIISSKQIALENEEIDLLIS